jgi:acetyl esterase/lipase
VATAVALMAKQRGGPSLAAQLLYYPVTDAGMDTGSYHQFAEGYFLAAAGVPVTAVRYGGIIHDFVMLHPLVGTHAARAAPAQGATFQHQALHSA